MKKYPRALKLLARVALTVLGTIQFIRPVRNLAQADDRVTDLFAVHPASPTVRAKVEASCYDCHSNRTEYPWYTNIQPIGWWMDRHIRDGKRELNFSEFANLSQRRQQSKLEAMLDAIADRSMPLPSYTWVHRGAKLSDEDIDAITEWGESFP